jgi:UDP-glucose 4-epimerase
MNEPPKAVAVTGSSGFVGARLLRTLEDEEEIGKLVAIDSLPPPAPVHNMAAFRMDVTGPIDEILVRHRVSTMVHLAFMYGRGRTRREINAVRQANLDVLGHVLDACVKAGVDHIIYLSSHTVYGARPDNPIPLTGDAPKRPLADFAYGFDKYLSEQLLEEFADQHQEKVVSVLRSCVVLGPSTDNRMAEGLFRKWLLGVSHDNPPMQFVYEDDLARVMTMFIKQRLPGVFNVAADGVVYYEEIANILESNLIRLPAFLAYPLTQLSWVLGIQREAPSVGLNMVRYPIIMSTAKLQEATGYKFRNTSLDALRAFAYYRMPEDQLT